MLSLHSRYVRWFKAECRKVRSRPDDLETNFFYLVCLLLFCVSEQSTWESHQLELARLENTPDGEKEHPRSIASIRRANTSDLRGSDNDDEDTVENHPTSIGSLCPNSTRDSRIHLICSWRAILGQEVVQGEHYLRRIPILPLGFFPGCPITASAEFAANREHDFSQSPFAKVSVVVKLKNRMLETPVSFSWSFSESQSSSSSFEWIGIFQQQVELACNEEISVPFEVLVCEPGIHNLQTLSFVVRRSTNASDQENVTYNLSQQWLLHLVDSSSR